MARYMEFSTADGGTILVEVEAEEERIRGLVQAGLGDKVRDAVVKVRDSFEATVMDALRRNGEAFISAMRSFSDPPSEATIAFGLKAAAEAGFTAIAKGSGEASYLVTLTWRCDPPARPPSA